MTFIKRLFFNSTKNSTETTKSSPLAEPTASSYQARAKHPTIQRHPTAPTLSDKIENALQTSVKSIHNFNGKLTKASVTMSAKSAFYGEKSFISSMLELAEIDLELDGDPQLGKIYMEIKERDQPKDGLAAVKPEPREIASYELPESYGAEDNIDDLVEAVERIKYDHQDFLKKTKRQLNHNPKLMTFFSARMAEEGGENLFGLFASERPQPAIQTIDNSSLARDLLARPERSTLHQPQNCSQKRVIHPPLEAHSGLRQKMTPGEQKVFEFFNQELHPDWEIYIQPHLNGLRPDFVLLNPNVGIAVFEVKDWNLNAMQYFTRKEKFGDYSLWAAKDGREFKIEKQNPVAKVARYKKEIFDLYCPRLQAGAGFGAITAGVIFPFAAQKQLQNVLQPLIKDDRWPQYRPISGSEALACNDVRAVFPESTRERSSVMSENLAADLRGWLVEPDFAKTQRTPLVLDPNQKQLASSRTQSGYRRIKGPAGSGKSLVLAARAARLANEGKSVLVATFNITLWHYLRDLIVRELDAPEKINNIKFTHFHLWCKHVVCDRGWEKHYDALFSPGTPKGSAKNVLDVLLPQLANDALMQGNHTRYDAILVDEGQDYHPLWWNILRKARKSEGEMLLVADATQDIYGTSRSWTDDAMAGAGFAGKWSQLDSSYRLPPDAMHIARTFAQTFLPQANINLPQPEQASLALYPCTLRWQQCDAQESIGRCVGAIDDMMRETGTAGLANADITLLSQDTRSGEDIAKALARKNVNSVNTFGQDHRRKKMSFYMGDARIKATTLHSFKGWESRLLVVYVDNATSAESLALIYAGLTRLKRSPEGSWLTVVSSCIELSDFGDIWPK